MKNLSHLFSKFKNYHLNELWFTAHSHHFWPDCTEKAVIDYWHDSALHVDDKWNLIFSEKVPMLQNYLSQWLKLSDSVISEKSWVFAPNTHELVYRLLTTFPKNKKIKILTTTSEFYSFTRQIKRLIESDICQVDFIDTEPYKDFSEALEHKLTIENYDLVFISHVFFNSGVRVLDSDLKKIYDLTKNKQTLVVLDAYHSFMAIPFSLEPYQDHFIYLAGSYKYAAAGEGLCFMYIPEKYHLKPDYTGWFAEFGNLSKDSKMTETPYTPGAWSMAGSTMDFSTLYKLNSIFSLYKNEKVTQEVIHDIVFEQQLEFSSSPYAFILNQTKKNNIIIDSECEQKILRFLNSDLILINDLYKKTNFPIFEKHIHGHFMTFELENNEAATDFHNCLKKNKIHIDYRKNRVRFGFGIY